MSITFTDLKNRILLSALFLLAAGVLVFYSYYPAVEFFITLLVIAIGSIGVWEFSNFCKMKKFSVNSNLMILFTALEIFSIYLSGLFTWAAEFPIAVLLLAIFTFSFMRFQEVNDAIATISVQFFSICYIAVPLGLMIKVLYPALSSHFDIRDGRMWFVYLIAITKITDVGAYFGGKLLGRKKLAPILSPGKTIEGAICGFVVAIGASLLFSILGQHLPEALFDLPFINAFFLGAALSLAGQMGDLSESLLKRDARIKDSNSLPGLGGVLDMFDSLLFSIPILFFYLYTV